MTVAKIPQSLPEVLKLTVDELQAFSVEQLQALHSIASTGSTKAAKGKVDLIAGIITGKQKEAKKAGTPEPVANSAKPTAARKKPQPQPPKPASTPKPQAAAGAAATPPKPASPPKPSNPPKPAAPKGQQTGAAKKPEDMTPEELIAYAKQLEANQGKQEKFPATFSNDKYVFNRFEPESVEELGAVLIAHAYRVFVLMDEKKDDDHTVLLLTYASSARMIMIDKSRDTESFITTEDTAGLIKRKAHVEKDGKTTYTFPVAFYVAEEIQQ